jgi:small GTP-binding protein
MSIIHKKICLIGDFGVGKTSLIRRYISDQFSDQYLSTIGVKISQKNIDISQYNISNQQLQLMIWDIEGRTKFQSITQEYLQGLHGAIIVADLNRKDSIHHLQDHIKLLTSVNSKGVALVVVLNKVDLFPNIDLEQIVLNLSQILGNFTQINSNISNVNRTLTLHSEVSLASSINFVSTQGFSQGIDFFTTSAKTGENVEMMFQALTILLLEDHKSSHYP